MSFRLYESAWVCLEGVEQPVQAHKDRDNMAGFNVGGYQYDIDARALPTSHGAPRISSILSLQDVREAGLRTNYNHGFGKLP